jgi:hypothetical protein
LRINTNLNLEFKPVKLGKKIELKYIPFSELAIPWNVSLDTTTSRQNNYCIKQSRFRTMKQINNGNARASRTLKSADFNALERSIAQFGLLKPFEVAEMQERLEFFYGKGKYLVIDGQRRYLAIRELLKLPTEDDERKQRDSLRTNCQHDYIVKGEIQAQEQYERLSIRNYVLIPCLVYPYKTLLQMIRHRIEDKRFTEKPSKETVELAERMCIEGVSDLNSDDLRELWKTRSRIEEKKKFIEKTLQEIRNTLKKEQKKWETEQDVSKAFKRGEE